VDERSRVLTATVLGAIAGGVWGWLYLTANGRRVRSQIEPKLDDFMRELANVRGTVEKARTAAMANVRGTVEKARTAANEGWRSLNEMSGGAAQGRWSA
jgi:hypothetical protein